MIIFIDFNFVQGNKGQRGFFHQKAALDSSKVSSMLSFVKLCFRKQNFLGENLTRTVGCIVKFYLYLYIYIFYILSQMDVKLLGTIRNFLSNISLN